MNNKPTYKEIERLQYDLLNMSGDIPPVICVTSNKYLPNLKCPVCDLYMLKGIYDGFASYDCQNHPRTISIYDHNYSKPKQKPKKEPICNPLRYSMCKDDKKKIRESFLDLASYLSKSEIEELKELL